MAAVRDAPKWAEAAPYDPNRWNRPVMLEHGQLYLRGDGGGRGMMIAQPGLPYTCRGCGRVSYILPMTHQGQCIACEP